MNTATMDHEVMLRRFQAVSDDTRLRLVRRLASGEECVCDLQGMLGAAQSRLSFHLRKLKDAGIVSDRREGRWVFYSLVPSALEEMAEFIGAVRSQAESHAGPGCGCGAACDCAGARVIEEGGCC